VSELASIKRDIRRTVAGVLEGSVERGIAAVAFQGFNVLLKGVEVERKVRETDELLARLEALEEAQGAGNGARTWR
jgi:hypothetical protein